MADTISKEQRSRVMAAVKSAGTAPEAAVRRLVYSLGYRYRLNVGNLPGRPDLVFKGRRKVIQVHGCFWHRHRGCKRATIPASNVEYWTCKLDANVRRDKRSVQSLRRDGWRVLVVWECQLARPAALATRIGRFLER